MAKILALDWDRHQLRYVLAIIGRRSVKVLAASVVPMSTVQGEGDIEERPDPAGTLRAKLGRKASRLPALVGVDRASIETLPLTLPPATDAELPELVLNQAMRESPTITEDTPLDFLPQNDDPSEPREVLVAALDPDAMGEIKRACSTAGIKPARMLMRPYASASLFLRSELAGDGEASLLVNLVGDEVDLTVVNEGRIVFNRTARIPHSDDQVETDRRVLSEIGRTLMVAMQHQIGDQSVRQICLCGGQGDHQGLIDGVAEQFDLPAVEFDPFDSVEIGRKAMPEEPGAFTALLGMLLDEAHGARHAIDFLHPREVPKPPNRGRLYVAVAALLITGAVFVWNQQSAELEKLDETIARLTEEHNARLAEAKQARYRILVAQSLRNWHSVDVNWLEELRDLSLRFPSGQDMVVLRMNLAPGRGGRGGAVTFSGLTRDPKILIRMEEEIRDTHHTIQSKRLQERGSSDLAWSFETSITTAPRRATEYMAHRTPENAAPQRVALGTQASAATATTAQPAAQQGGRP
jgi:Tfp pilus assembly PilM family ATPase